MVPRHVPPGAPHRVALQSILQRRAGGAEIQRVDLGAPILKSMLYSGFFVFFAALQSVLPTTCKGAEKQLEQRVDLGPHILKSSSYIGNFSNLLDVY
jgi:hypothetical protein